MSNNQIGTEKIFIENESSASLYQIQEDNLPKKSKQNTEIKRGQTKIYFGNDNANTEKDGFLSESYFNKKHEVAFSIKQYSEFLLLHLINYLVLGPFIIIHSLIFWRQRYLVYNLQFLRLTPAFVIQLFNWALSVSTIYFVLTKDSIVVNRTMVFMIGMCTIIRASSIAGKYATFPPRQIQHIKQMPITTSEIQSELMVGDWSRQTDPLVKLEIENSSRRIELDESLFYIAFMVEPEAKLKQKLDDIRERLFNDDDYPMYKQEVKEGKTILYYQGKVIFAYLLLHYNEKNPFRVVLFLISIFITVAISMFPGILRLFYRETFHGTEVFEIILFYCHFLYNGMLILVLITFYLRFYGDLKRIVFLLAQLGQVISPKNFTDDYTTKKIFPTINLTSKKSIHSWLLLRRLSSDYGKKYLHRHEIFLPVLLLTCLTSFLLFLDSSYFHLLPLSPIASDRAPTYRSLLLLTVLVLMLISFSLLLLAGSINDFFGSHVHSIIETRLFFKDLAQFSSHYHSGNSRDFLRCRFLRDSGSSREGAEEVVAAMEEVREVLRDQSEFQAYKVLGHTVTTGAVWNLAGIGISLAITGYEMMK